MPGPSPVPPDLLKRPFTLAEAGDRGLSLDVLRSSRFWTPVRGVRAATGLADNLEVRCRALALVADTAAFSHLTAARLCALPVPGRCSPLGPTSGPSTTPCASRPGRARGPTSRRG